MVPVLAAAAGAELTLDVVELDIAPEYPPDVLPILGKLFPAPYPLLGIEVEGGGGT